MIFFLMRCARCSRMARTIADGTALCRPHNQARAAYKLGGRP